MDIERTEQLSDYLRASGRIPADEPIAATPLTGGVSSRTVWVDLGRGESWVLKQALFRLRVQAEWTSDPERVHREALGMRWLRRFAPEGSIPEFLFEDRHHQLIAMRAVPRPHDNWKTLLLEGRLEESHVQQFGTLLARIHRNAWIHRAELPAEFEARDYFESLRVEPYYRYAAERVPAAAGFLRALIDATDSRRLTLVHGDFSPKNILIHRGRLVLVDHEVIHLGDPAFDVGFALTHLLSKANHLAARRRDFAREASRFWRVYQEAVEGTEWASTLEPFVVRHSLACLLARVAGRSPLEYLETGQRDRQQRAALDLMRQPPSEVGVLVEQFIGTI